MQKLNGKFLAFLILFSTVTQAANPEVVPLKTGDLAPFTGYEVTPAKVQKIYGLEIELDSEKKQNALLQQEEALYDKRISNAQEETNQLSKELAEERDKSFIGKVGYFVIGAVVTGAIAYGVTRSLR